MASVQAKDLKAKYCADAAGESSFMQSLENACKMLDPSVEAMNREVKSLQAMQAIRIKMK